MPSDLRLIGALPEVKAFFIYFQAPDMESQSTKILGQDSIHRLCAGQVIVSLESTVKELLENALDARATSIGTNLQRFHTC